MALAVLLAVLGAGVSYSGYNASLQTTTSTSTQLVTATSTRTLASTSRELVLMTTSGTSWILQDELIDIPAGTTQVYCGYTASRHAYLEAGQVHVSYHTESTYHPVDFWMMTEDQWTRWSNLRYCSQLLAFQGIATKISRSGYEFTTEIGSAGAYYFAFMNENRYPITVTLNVDAGLQTSEVTLTKATTVYSTQVSPYVTEKVTVSTRPVGFGLLFYAGIGLIAVAVIALAISRMKNAAPRTAPPSTLASVVHAGPVVSPPPAPTTGKFCTNCGAPLPARATFCNKCGTKQ
ncbi:MAG: zinc ribbon domain-containing protein [Candidatus Bathyarchaeia archaeon]